MTARVAGTALAALLLGWSPTGVGAQLPSDSAALAAAEGRMDGLEARYARVAVSPHAHGTMVGVALRVPAGSAHDPVGREGTAWLLARVRERQATELLDPSRAALTARVERNATVYTLLATPEAWSEELGWVEDLLFESPVPVSLVEAERARLLETLRFQVGSPVRTFETEAASLLVEPESPWATPLRGTPASVETLDAAGLAAWQEERVRRATTTLALAGPLAQRRRTGADPAADSAGAGADPPSVPWLVGDRVALVQEVTSAWLSVAYPAPDTLPRTALELLAHLVEEELDPVPPDPDRYSVEVRLEDTPDGPALVVQASLLPEALDRWERRIVQAVEGLARAPMDDDFFRWKRRRFRTRRLLAETAPEAEAARMTRDLALLGEARTLDPAVWRLDARDLVEAARALGEPRILLLGPDLGQDGPDGAGGPDPAHRASAHYIPHS